MKKSQPTQSKPLERAFSSLMAHGHSIWQLFDDFLVLSVAALMWDEESYQKVSKKYQRKGEMETWQIAFSDLVSLMEDSAQEHDHKISDDILWEFYMEFVSHWEHGQYFTPQHVCDMMAQITNMDKDMSQYNAIDRATANDPACGSGRFGLAFAKLVGKRKCTIYLQDLDRRCCLMAVINLILNWIDWDVYRSNTLSMEIFEWWRVRVWWWLLPSVKQITITDEDRKPSLQDTKVVEEKKELEKKAQQSLFNLQ
jgi:type I restriction-modification system DNA methylase subunit